jgi:hypothetical protein
MTLRVFFVPFRGSRPKIVPLDRERDLFGLYGGGLNRWDTRLACKGSFEDVWAFRRTHCV